MRELRDGVGLVHELRELGRPEELADDGGDGTHVDEPRRRDLHGILRRHALFDEALEARHTDAELVLQQFPTERTRRLPRWSISSMVPMPYFKSRLVETAATMSSTVMHL